MAVADGVLAVAGGGEVVMADGVPAVAGGSEAATAGAVPATTGGGEAISNDTTGDVGGADAGGAVPHPPLPDCGSGAHVTLIE